MPSLNPKEFKTDPLSVLPVEEVVNKFKGEERKRRENTEDEQERIVPVRFRSRPAGLEILLDELGESLGVGNQVLTRCMGRHAESWLRSLPQVPAIVSLYKVARSLSDGHSDMEEQMKRSVAFNFVSSVPVGGAGMTSYSSVAWINSYFDNLAIPLSITLYRLYLIGLCWSATTNISGVRSQAIKQYILPEVRQFTRHLDERSKVLSCFCDILVSRDVPK